MKQQYKYLLRIAIDTARLAGKFLRDNKSIIKTLSSLRATDVYIANKNTAYKILQNARENVTDVLISTEPRPEEYNRELDFLMEDYGFIRKSPRKNSKRQRRKGTKRHSQKRYKRK